MVVKSKIGRKRYIIFKIESNSIISKRDFIYTINRILSNHNTAEVTEKSSNNTMTTMPIMTEHDQILSNDHDHKGKNQFTQLPWVIFIKNNFGLIRCHHLDKDKTLELLLSIKHIGGVNNHVKIETLGTTGTIRSARKKYLDKLILYPLRKV